MLPPHKEQATLDALISSYFPLNMAVYGVEALMSDDEKYTTMTSVERYQQEWEKLISMLDENFECIRDLAFRGELKVSKFRSIYWTLLLRVLSTDYSSWKDQRQQQRNRYEKLKQEFINNPHETKVPDDDPLSQSKQSVWNQYFSDQELFNVIKQDVVRTFPGVDFFRKSTIQSAMTNILFYYAREHPYMCYRQGMHEILAPILFVMFGDHQSLLHFKEISKERIDDLLMEILNPDYLEADSYSIFSRIMSSIESYYRITNVIQTPGGYFLMKTDSSAIATEVEVIGQLNSIRDKILAKEDLHLHNYLMKLDIPLHIFGIRWLRLLFGREFPLLDLLMLWDAIFADSDRFDLPNYILVAMLIHIRDKLLLNDYTNCLTHLMRYPTNVDINLILRHALHMQMPKKFDRPANAFVYFTMNPDNSTAAKSDKNQSAASSFSSKKTSEKNAKLSRNQSVDKKYNRSSSLGGDRNFKNHIDELQTQNAADSAVRARMKVTNDSGRVIMDGYSENSPELLRLELKNAQTIISVSKNKLQNYVKTIRKYSGKIDSEELNQAIKGVEELCIILDTKPIFPHLCRYDPIDQAFEANENQRQSKNQIGNAIVETAMSFDDKNESLEPPFYGTVVTEKNSGTIYEKPDTSFMLNSFRILGNRKEVELVQLASDEKTIETMTSWMPKQTSGIPIIDPLGCREE